jgi:hypothetical protein
VTLKPAKVLATRGDAPAATAPSEAKLPAKPNKFAQVRHRVRAAHAKPLPAPTAYTRSLALSETAKPVLGKHRKVAAVKPAGEQGDGGAIAKPAARAKPMRARAKPEKPAADE